MNYVINLPQDVYQVIDDPELVDAIKEFVAATGIAPKDITSFYPDLHKGGSWVFNTTLGRFAMQQAHTVWDPDVVETEIEQLEVAE